MKKVLVFALILVIFTCLFISCGGNDSESETESNHSHSYGEWQTVTEATCVNFGLKKQYCDCGDFIEKKIDATGIHIYKDGKCKHCETPQPESQGLAFELDATTDTYIVTGIGDCKDTDISIPKTHNNKPVTIIGKDAFRFGNSITSVSIPNSVTSIGYRAFDDCTSLTSVTIPNSVIEIGESAFSHCSNLRSITIPNSVIEIKSNVFGDCTSLTSIIIPNSITKIGEYAFFACSSLTSIIIPNSVTSISITAFSHCDKLVEMYNLSSLNVTLDLLWGDGKIIHTSLDEPSILETIDDYIFMTWDNKYYLIGYIGDATEIKLPKNYKGSSYEIYQYAFYKCDGITAVTIPNGVTAIGHFAFDYCNSLINVTMPDSVTQIGDSAFSHCYKLESITIPNGVTYIGVSFDEYNYLKFNEYNNAYYLGNDTNPYLLLVKAKNTTITSCQINSNTKFIGSSAFANCSSLAKVIIGDNVTKIGGYAFSKCKSLTSITIPNGVATIGNGAFYLCSSLMAINCKANSKPAGWRDQWVGNSNSTVVWGYTGE